MLTKLLFDWVIPARELSEIYLNNGLAKHQKRFACLRTFKMTNDNDEKQCKILAAHAFQAS